MAKAYEDIEYVYYSRFPNTASGTSLDRLGVFAGITRNPATYSTRTITVHGDANTEVMELKVCGENDEIIFHNTASFIIPESGNIDILVECETAGEKGNISIINKIVNPIAGVNSVSYIGSVDDVDGLDVESDYDFRKRWNQSISGRGTSNSNSIVSAILNVPTVQSVCIIENNENDEVDGRPPHSFECYVYGGENYHKEIAEAIYSKKPIGIQAYGTITIDVPDAGGTIHPIKFSQTSNIPVYISVKYKKNSRFEADGEEQIKNILADHINSHRVGEGVTFASLYSYIFDVEGVRDVTELLIGVSADALATDNIDVKDWEIAITDVDKIEVAEVA